MKRYADAIAQAAQYIERHGDDVAVLDVLKVAHFYSGRKDEAIRYGQRVIELRDAEACARAPAPLPEPSGRQGLDVIAFSLWGADPIYNYGAMINLALSKVVYSDWTCRFYVDASVPRATRDFLAENGGEVIDPSNEFPAVPGYFRRFLPFNDPAVTRVLVRDCDSRLSDAEAALTSEWRASGYSFYVIRDHVLHNDLMLAGLWGGRADCGIDIVELMRRYFVRGSTAKYGHDQRMLGLMLWPLIRGRCLVHDKYYRLPGVHTIPLPDPNSHFGAGHQNLTAVLGEVERLGIPRVL